MQNLKTNRKPIYLLADSQLFFYGVNNKLITSLRNELKAETPNVTKAAYIGASNNDQPAFFDLFVAAMDSINTHECRMIRSSRPMDEDDELFLKAADLILLAGGETQNGWETMSHNNMQEIIAQKYCSGAVLVGVSAGAVQLGMGFVDVIDGTTVIDTLRLVPYYVSTNDDESDWQKLKQILKSRERYCKGFGISSGAGFIYHPDSSVEPLHKSLYELEIREDEGRETIRANVLLPPEYGP